MDARVTRAHKAPQPTQERLRELFIDLGHTVQRVPGTSASRHTGPITTKDGRGYLTVKVDGRQVNVHRVLWIMRHGPIPAGMYVDHRDGDKLNNADGNLRVASPEENNRNRRMSRHNTSGAKNVSWNKNTAKWQVQMCAGGGKAPYFGGFDSLEDAIEVAKLGREMTHGEFHNHAEGRP